MLSQEERHAVAYRFAAFDLLPAERSLRLGGMPVQIGQHAFDLLVALVERPAQLIRKEELMRVVWGRTIVEENTLQSHISALRKVLGPAAISTVPGKGYRFVLEVGRLEADTRPKHNLPAPLTTFVGREKEISELTQLLTTTRLLTLTGAGGCGKTRLALEFGRTAVGMFPDGVFLVELAAIAQPALVGQAVADAFGIREAAGADVLQTLATHLEHRRLLLVVDNAEHLIEACAELTDTLLQRCAQLKVLVTSRERLGVGGELIYRVPSLSLSTVGPDTTLDEALACEAARLFIERARLQRPGLTLSAEDSRALLSVCHQLDGAALAIELAAARVRAMSISELSRRLDDRFNLLTGGSRTAPPRHRTLRSLIDWSHELLDDLERTMLRRVSVFSGGWTTAAAEAICAGDGLTQGQVLDLLTSLVDKSLLWVDARTGTTRFSMLETIRQYALHRLHESGEEDALRGRLLDFLLGMSTRLDAVQSDEERQQKLDLAEQERENIRSTLDWCERDQNRVQSGLQLTGQLFWLWVSRLRPSEGTSRATRLLALDPRGGMTEARGKALHVAGTLTARCGDYAGAEPFHRAALEVWTALGDLRQMARSIGSIGNSALIRGDYALARLEYERALAIMRERGDRGGIAVDLLCLAGVAYRTGDLTIAQIWIAECIALSREVGSYRLGEALCMQGQIRLMQGDSEGALASLTAAVDEMRRFDHKGGLANCLANLGRVLHAQGQNLRAKEHHQESMSMLHELGAALDMSDCALSFAPVLLDLGMPLDAARLWGWDEKAREELASVRDPVLVAPYERDIAAARRACGDTPFYQAWAEGRAWSMGELVQFAMAI